MLIDNVSLSNMVPCIEFQKTHFLQLNCSIGLLHLVNYCTWMFSHVCQTYLSPLMAANIASTVQSCPHCARNRLLLILQKKPMRLFTSKQSLESYAFDLLGPLPKTKADNHFILVMADCFTKLTSRPTKAHKQSQSQQIICIEMSLWVRRTKQCSVRRRTSVRKQALPKYMLYPRHLEHI